MKPDELSALAGLGSAGVAFLALIVAVIAAVVTWRTNAAQQQTLELQRQQFAAVEERVEREQASKVTFVLHGGTTAVAVDPIETRYIKVGHYGGRLFNASDSPVFDVVLYQDDPKRRLLGLVDNLIPTSGVPVDLPLKPKEFKTERSYRMLFRDSAGIYWVRSRQGELRKADDAEIREILNLRVLDMLESADDQSTAGGDRAGDPPDQGSDRPAPEPPT